ncbi:MAG TPA: sialidase, partial [Bacteroidota bacterium]|nr:sialidase [Bacteroidota bacterium]
NIKGLPKYAWVSSVDAGHLSEGTACASFDLHAFGDMTPYIYRTTDYGKTWAALAGKDSPMRGFAHVVKEDLINKDLLFAGTEFGLWISLDGGAQWAQYKGGNFPDVAVHDLVVHPRDNDLVVATHGRGIWIVDDISPLRALTPAALASEAMFIPGRPTVQPIGAWGGWAEGDAMFSGPNPPDDAVITYYQKKRHIFGDLKIEIFDSSGKSMGVVPSSKRRGLSRATWSMRLKAPRVPTAATAAFGAATGPRVLPGTYTVKITKDISVYTATLNVVPDPRSKHTAAGRKAQFDLAMKLHGLLGDMTFTVDRINGVRSALADRASKLPADDALAKRLGVASDQADVIRKKIVATKEGGMITGEERLREYMADLYGSVNGYEGRPSQMQVDRTEALGMELSDVSGEFEAWAAKELPDISAELAKKNLGTITLLAREEWEKADTPK